MNLTDFVAEAAGCGPCVGVHPQISSPLAPPDRVELRTISAAHATTLDGLFDAFAEAWDFPPWFGRNGGAFDDFMRDWDNMIDAAQGKPSAPGYLTDVRDAHLLLSEEPDAFPWFVNCIPFYREYYRDQEDPTAAFGLLLSAPTPRLDKVRERWLYAGVEVASINV